MLVANETSASLNAAGCSVELADCELWGWSAWPSDAELEQADRNTTAAEAASAARTRVVEGVMPPPYLIPHGGIGIGLVGSQVKRIIVRCPHLTCPMLFAQAAHRTTTSSPAAATSPTASRRPPPAACSGRL